VDDLPEPEAVTLVDEDGREREFVLHDAFDVEGVEYYLVESAENPEMVLILREQGGALTAVEGEEFDRVMRILEADDA
jgi:uncharacterized protein YrzB (UPF0473 family)